LVIANAEALDMYQSAYEAVAYI